MAKRDKVNDKTKGPGRPCYYGERMKILTLRIPFELYERLRDAAGYKSMADFVRTFIERAVQPRKKQTTRRSKKG